MLIEHNTLNDQTIDALYHIFSESVKTFHDKITQQKLLKSKEFLEKLKQREKFLQEKDNLDQLLADI